MLSRAKKSRIFSPRFNKGVLFIYNPHEHPIALHEALITKTPTLCFGSSNLDSIDYPIPLSFNGLGGGHWYIKFWEAILRCRKKIVLKQYIHMQRLEISTIKNKRKKSLPTKIEPRYKRCLRIRIDPWEIIRDNHKFKKGCTSLGLKLTISTILIKSCPFSTNQGFPWSGSK